jgi:hypothetical protein
VHNPLVIKVGEGPIGVKLASGQTSFYCVMTVPGLEPGICPATHDLQCQSRTIAGDQIVDASIAMGWVATMNAISPANLRRDPASVGITREMRHGGCIAVRVLPFGCSADVRPGILLHGGNRRTTKRHEEGVDVNRRSLADSCQFPMPLPPRNLYLRFVP